MISFEKVARPEEVFLSRWHPYAWIAFAALIVYIKTLAYGFTGLDDNALISNNYAFLSDASHIFQAFRQKVFANSVLPYYRPMLIVSFIIDAQIGGLSPVVYHLHNIILHLAVSCLVFSFLVMFGAGRDGSFFSALIFAVHPALAQAVAWIPGRNDSLLALFVLLSLISFLDFVKTGRALSAAGHLIFFALALFTKESGVMVPVLATLYLIVVKKGRIFSRGLIALWCGYAAIVAVWVSMRSAATSGSLELSLYDSARFVAMYLPAVVQLLGKALFPVRLSVFPTMQDTPLVYGVVALLAIVGFLAVSKAKRYDRVIFGATWFLLFLVPSLVRPHAGVINDVLEHRLYLPIMGLFIIFLAAGIRADRRKAARYSAIVIVIVFAVLAVGHSDDFRDRFSFWENAVAASPDSPYAHLLLGTVYYEDDLVKEAELELKKALALDTQLMRTHYFLGLTYMKKLMFKAAEVEFRKEIALYPDYDAPYSSLATALYKQGRREGLDGIWKKALELNPDNLEAYRNLAIYYGEKGDKAGALACVQKLTERGVDVPEDFFRTLGP